MLGRVFKYIDSLFYTTTISTTIRTTTTVYHNVVPVEETFEVFNQESAVTWEGDNFIINDRVIPIPDVVKNRRPITDIAAFPYYRFSPIVMDVIFTGPAVRRNDDIQSRQFVNEIKLARNATYSGFNKLKVMGTTSDAYDLMNKNENSNSFNVSSALEDLKIDLYLTEDWAFFNIESKNGWITRLYHENSSLYKSDNDCVIAAYAYARAIIVNAGPYVTAIRALDEDHLATTLLAMMMVERI